MKSLNDIIPIGKVYLITNIVNNKKYVGITSRTLSIRLSNHIYDSKKNCVVLHKAIRKYGAENFIIELIEEFANITERDLLAKESFYIDKFGTFVDDGNGYNMVKKSDHKLIISDSTKRKLSRIGLGKNNPFYGKKHTTETIHKIIDTFKKNYKKENHPFYKKHHSDETKRKISNSKLGQTHTEETKLQMSNSHRGMEFSVTHRENLSKAASDTYKITFKDGRFIVVLGLNKFAKENGYSQGNLYGIFCGQRKKHKDIIGG